MYPVSFLTPLQVTRSFGDEVWRLSAIEIAFSIGMTAGGILIALWGGFKNKIHTLVLSNFVIAICTFSLGLTPIFWIYLFLMDTIGIVIPMFNTPFMVLLQNKVKTGFLGRVFGVFSMISTSMMPLAMLAYGPLADVMRIEWLLVVTGIFILIESLIMLGDKILIETGKPEQ